MHVAAVELQQQEALLEQLPLLFSGADADSASCIASVLEQVKGLGTLISESETMTEISASTWVVDPGPYYVPHHISFKVQVTDGAECITEMNADLDVDNGVQQQAGPFLQHLTLLAEKLPSLHRVGAHVGANGEAATYSRDHLPSGLPAAAPHLISLNLAYNGLVGRLPEEWANWTSIQDIEVSSNKLTGTLPDSWGQAAQMPSNLRMNFRGNSNLSGTVPTSWAHFSFGYINLEETHVGGCMPGNVSSTLPSCESIAQAVEAAPLLALKKLMAHAGAASTSGLVDWKSGEHFVE
jgi:hypothetical protein